MTYYDYTEYGRMLLSTLARSEASSYNRVIEDTRADGELVRPFVAVACAVADMDSKRQRSLAYVGELSEGEIANALGRIHENRMVTAWVHRALHWRLASYRYALERLVISVPSAARRRGRARAQALCRDRGCGGCAAGAMRRRGVCGAGRARRS